MYIKKKTYEIGLGDSAELILQHLEENSIHAVITDPPYGIHALGADWDRVLPLPEIWQACFKALKPGGFLLAFGHPRLYHRLGMQLEDVGFEIKDCLCWGFATGFPRALDISRCVDRSEDAQTWEGWKTGLKPSWESIIMAQKPLEGTYVENILKWHVGALNIDACRIPYESEEDKKSIETFLNFAGKEHGDAQYFSANEGGKKQVNVHPGGRWPANLVWLDPLIADYDRFFMVPKPSKQEKRSYNTHDTVKPVRLMERLVKLVTPKPANVEETVNVLDPFMGSASTGKACKKLRRRFIGYENDPKSFEIAQKRLKETTYIDIFEGRI